MPLSTPTGQHKSSAPDAWLPLERESHGTQQLFRLAPLIIATLDAGAVLVVDELEANFHPLLALQRRGYLQGRYGGIPFLGPLTQVSQ